MSHQYDESDTQDKEHTWDDFFAIRYAVEMILHNVSLELNYPDSDIWSCEYLYGTIDVGVICGFTKISLAQEVMDITAARLHRRGFGYVVIQAKDMEDGEGDEDEIYISVSLGKWSGRNNADEE